MSSALLHAPRMATAASARRRSTGLHGALLFGTLILLVLAASTLARPREIATTWRWIGLGLVGVAGFAARTVSGWDRRIRTVDRYAAIWVLGVGLSAYYSIDPRLTLMRTASVAIMYAAIFWGAWRVADHTDATAVLSLISLASGVIFLAGLAASGTEAAWLGGRYRGILQNPNAVGLFSAIIVPVIFERILSMRQLRYIALFALVSASLAMSGSRGGTLGALVGLGYVVSCSRRRNKLLAVVAVLAILAWMLVPSEERAAAQGHVLRPDSLRTGSGRTEAWEAAIHLISDRPLLGYGFGTEERLFEAYGFASGFRESAGLYVHNSYLGLTTQVGLVGALAFFLPLVLLLRGSVRRSRGAVALHWINGLEGVLVAGLVACVFESWIYSMGNAFAFPFWLCVMLLVRGKGEQGRRLG